MPEVCGSYLDRTAGVSGSEVAVPAYTIPASTPFRIEIEYLPDTDVFGYSAPFGQLTGNTLFIFRQGGNQLLFRNNGLQNVFGTMNAESIDDQVNRIFGTWVIERLQDQSTRVFYNGVQLSGAPFASSSVTIDRFMQFGQTRDIDSGLKYLSIEVNGVLTRYWSPFDITTGLVLPELVAGSDATLVGLDGGSNDAWPSQTAQWVNYCTLTPPLQATPQVLNLNITEIPDGTYPTAVIDPSAETVLFNADLAWTSGAAFVDVGVGALAPIAVEYYVYDNFHGAVGVGTTSDGP